MNILFVDHECHLRTHSADFFLGIIASGNAVRTAYCKTAYDCRLAHDDIAWAELVIFWEFLPSRFEVGCVGKPCVFVPMYDNEWGSRFQWRRIALSGMAVLSFCDRLSEHARRCGVTNLLTVHYAIDPADFAGHSGDAATAALWERGDVTLDTLKALFPKGVLRRTVLLRRGAIAHTASPITESEREDWNIELHEGGFVSKEESRQITKDCGIYIAPRFAEGIGMAFLEALAAGKCVIAHDNATMNEYIEDGKSGILVDMRRPSVVDMGKVATVRANMPAVASSLHSRWLAERETIAPFLRRVASGQAVRSLRSPLGILLFALYLAEGAVMRLKEKIS